MKHAIIFGLMISCCSATAFAQADPVIEGQVFDANQTPLQNVEVRISSEDTPPLGARVFTDSNGFFSITSPELYVDQSVQITARCLVLEHRTSPPIYYTTGSTHSIVVRDGVMNRNLYIQNLPKRKKKKEKEKESFHCLTRLPVPP